MSVSADRNSLLIPNLEPSHVYRIQVAGYNSQGEGPFSNMIQVKPDPDLFQIPAFQGISSSSSSNGQKDKDKDGNDSTSAWLIPVTVVFAILVCLLAVALFYSRKMFFGVTTTGATHHRHVKMPAFSSGFLSTESRKKKVTDTLL